MSKILSQLLTFVLVCALAVDPLAASAALTSTSGSIPPPANRTLFESEAFSARSRSSPHLPEDFTGRISAEQTHSTYRMIPGKLAAGVLMGWLAILPAMPTANVKQLITGYARMFASESKRRTRSKGKATSESSGNENDQPVSNPLGASPENVHPAQGYESQGWLAERRSGQYSKSESLTPPELAAIDQILSVITQAEKLTLRRPPNYRAPGTYAGSPIPRIMIGLRRLGVRPGDRLMDLGSGLGYITLNASRLFQMVTEGYEHDPYRAAQCEKTIELLEERGILPRGQAVNHYGDFLERSWTDFDLIYYYTLGAPEETVERINLKLIAEAKPGARFVVLGLNENFVYLYQNLQPLFHSNQFEFESMPDLGIWVFTRKDQNPPPASLNLINSARPAAAGGTSTKPTTALLFARNIVVGSLLCLAIGSAVIWWMVVPLEAPVLILVFSMWLGVTGIPATILLHEAAHYMVIAKQTRHTPKLTFRDAHNRLSIGLLPNADGMRRSAVWIGPVSGFIAVGAYVIIRTIQFGWAGLVQRFLQDTALFLGFMLPLILINGLSLVWGDGETLRSKPVRASDSIEDMKLRAKEIETYSFAETERTAIQQQTAAQKLADQWGNRSFEQLYVIMANLEHYRLDVRDPTWPVPRVAHALAIKLMSSARSLRYSQHYIDQVHTVARLQHRILMVMTRTSEAGEDFRRQFRVKLDPTSRTLVVDAPRQITPEMRQYFEKFVDPVSHMTWVAEIEPGLHPEKIVYRPSFYWQDQLKDAALWVIGAMLMGLVVVWLGGELSRMLAGGALSLYDHASPLHAGGLAMGSGYAITNLFSPQRNSTGPDARFGSAA